MFTLTLTEPVTPEAGLLSKGAQRFSSDKNVNTVPHLRLVIAGPTPAITREQDLGFYRLEIVDVDGNVVPLPEDLESHHQYLYAADGHDYSKNIKVRLQNVTFKIWFPSGIVLLPGLYALRVYAGDEMASTVLDLR